MSKDRLVKLEQRLGHRFRSSDLLPQALTHSSATGESSRNNERLEFLGDRVLALLVADLLLQHFPDASEGDLALRLNALVRRETCAAVALEVELGACLTLAPAEAASGGRDKPAILGDACEAVIGALYLDGGMAAARGFVEMRWTPRLTGLATAPADAKSALQEWSQARKLGTPDYTVISRDGPDHAPVFVIEVQLPGHAPACGTGASKREAEQAAALAMRRAVDTDFIEPENI
ncbi:MAG: ribonuclease III [Alphaproteobacteria bacterium]|nr:ribonuclease III [Alphaproteobacteria bacterium]